MEECIDLELEVDSLIDDKQFSENSAGFNIHELAGGLSTENEIDNSLCINESDELPELRGSMEPGRNKKNGRYNLRKSLAWDSAFFTSAGVLDAEELSTMITGEDKCEKHSLPGIQEDITESTESLSSLGSDTLTMETHEDDLFVDIRASIQRSSKRASNMKISNSKTAPVDVDNAPISSLKKEDPVTKNKNPKLGSQNTSSLQSVRMSKCQPKQNIGKLGSGKAIKQETVHSQTSVAKIGQTNSVLPRPPKTIRSSIPSSTAAQKRESVGPGRAKSASGISNPVTQPPKVSSLDSSRRALPKSAQSSNISLLPSSTTSSTHSTMSSTSSDGSTNTSSRINPVKPILMMARRSTSKSDNVGRGPTSSIPKNPSRATVKNKLPLSSTRSAYQMAAKIPLSVSPASSISEWSSVSSSSSSMVIPKSSNSRTSLDTSSCTSMEGDVVPMEQRKHSAGRTADGHGYQGVSNNSKKSSTPTGGNLQAPSKPSGLRMPSHKFGFFDGGKSSARSPNMHQQSPSAAHNGIPKNGPATGMPVRSSNGKLKSAKAQTSRMLNSPASLKLSSSPKLTSPASIKLSSSPKLTSPASLKLSSSPKLTSPASLKLSSSPKLTSPASIKPGSSKSTSTEIIKPSYSKPTSPASITPDSTKPTSLETMKPGSPKPISLEIIKPSSPKPASPAPFQEIASIIPTDVINSYSLSVGVKGSVSKESCQDTDKVSQVVADIDAIIKSLGDMKINTEPVVEQNNALGGDVAVDKNLHEYDFDPICKEATGKYIGEGLTGDGESTHLNVYGSIDELLSDISECETIASETAVCREPLALKNYFVSDECSDVPKECVIQVASDKMDFLLPASDQKENR
ncbi:hypothetical protein CASFOL_032116 [Castilleja foliolosa]|uniref:Uncharacterized protein n=1 Tax=Castilleja foliolosa TaxID=1961234 RepID=A0ABD3C0I2_9LAMI